MKKSYNFMKICLFCGKERQITHITEDGIDWCGHQRMTGFTDVIDKGCDCKLAKIAREGIEITQMCLN